MALAAAMARIEGGDFSMGTGGGFPYEGPAHTVTVASFEMDVTEVTVAGFAAFVKASGYRTEAEKFGWSGVFDLKTGEWRRVDGANWRHPDGPKSNAGAHEPVTQVSWNDAAAYAKWARKRLPPVADCEYAARGGLSAKIFPWGDELRPGGKFLANWWQGTFPAKNTGQDGHLRRAPAGRFPPNGYGLHGMAGNVWEWCADWFDAGYYSRSPPVSPQGPPAGAERVMRGGSWLCSESHCRGYRVAARGHSTPDSGLNNVGFRCVR